MGIFSKKNGYEAAAMELEAARDQRRRERASAPSTSQAASPQPQALSANPAPSQESIETPKAPTPAAYGIEDVIQLMRNLPDNKKETVILIVQKTLISAKIDINHILDKGAHKIDNLQVVNDKLKTEILALEELIIQKKSDVDQARRDIEETQQVMQSFEMVYKRSQQTANPQASTREPLQAIRDKDSAKEEDMSA